jgi:dihydroneopterin aldolase
MIDTIELRGIRAFGHHGANPGEKNIAQPFDVDVTLEVDLSAARRSDDLRDTIDYSNLHATIVRIIGGRSFSLLERLGQEVLDAILSDGRIMGASVRIAKPQLLAGATPAVTLHGERTR